MCNQINRVESNYFFFFLDIDLTFLIDDLLLVSFHKTNTAFHEPANAHFNTVKYLEKKKESVDNGNKKRTTLDSAYKDLAKEKIEKSSNIENNSDDDKRGLNLKEVQNCQKCNLFFCRSIKVGSFRKDLCKVI